MLGDDIKKLTVGDTLNEREKTHGDFCHVSAVAQILKDTVRHHSSGRLPNYQREALDLICTKIARIVCGNYNEPDHFRDICGYSQLILNELEHDDG